MGWPFGDGGRMGFVIGQGVDYLHGNIPEFAAVAHHYAHRVQNWNKNRWK